jgi:hypothetical protein
MPYSKLHSCIICNCRRAREKFATLIWWGWYILCDVRHQQMTLLLTWLLCSSQFNWLSTIKPRYLKCFTLSISLPSIKSLVWDQSDQFEIKFRSCCMSTNKLSASLWLLYITTVSSAYSWNFTQNRDWSVICSHFLISWLKIITLLWLKLLRKNTSAYMVIEYSYQNWRQIFYTKFHKFCTGSIKSICQIIIHFDNKCTNHRQISGSFVCLLSKCRKLVLIDVFLDSVPMSQKWHLLHSSKFSCEISAFIVGNCALLF